METVKESPAASLLQQGSLIGLHTKTTAVGSLYRFLRNFTPQIYLDGQTLSMLAIIVKNDINHGIGWRWND